MKNYSYYDFKEGDIYEHFGGGLWMIAVLNDSDKTYTSVRVNDTLNNQIHSVEDIKQAWFCDQ